MKPQWIVWLLIVCGAQNASAHSLKKRPPAQHGLDHFSTRKPIDIPHLDNGALLPAGWSFVSDPTLFLKGHVSQNGSSAEDRHAHVERERVERPVEKQTLDTLPEPVKETKDQSPSTEPALPLDQDIPMAAFREKAHIVLVIGSSNLRGVLRTSLFSGFAPVNSVTFPGVTVVTLNVSGHDGIKIQAEQNVWKISHTDNGDEASQEDMLLGRLRDGLSLTPPHPDMALQVVQIKDPISGRHLWVGLSHSGRLSSPMALRGSGYALRASILGVVAAVDSDSIELRLANGRFVLDAIGSPQNTPFAAHALSSTGASLANVALGEGLDSSETMFHDVLRSAAYSSPGERLNARIKLAQVAARMGQGAMLSQVLQVAVKDDPESYGRKDVRRLMQVASVLSGRVNDETLVEDGDNTLEDQLWRGIMRTLPLAEAVSGDELVRLRDVSERQRTAHLIATGLSAADHYALPLRTKIQQIAAQWIGAYGRDEDVKSLDTLPDVPKIQLARALYAARKNDPKADHLLEALSKSASPQIWPAARLAHLEWMLKNKTTNPRDIALDIEKILPGFRMAGREEDARALRLQALVQAGDERSALNAFLEGRSGQQKPMTSAEQLGLRTVAHTMLARIPDSPADLAEETKLIQSLLTVCGDELSDVRSTYQFALAERYKALGLPSNEYDALQHIQGEEEKKVRQERLVRLAELALDSGKFDTAQQDLSQLSDDVAVSSGQITDANSDVADKIAQLRARLALSHHDSQGAVTALRNTVSPKSLAMRADLEEELKNWADAKETVSALVKNAFHGQGQQAPMNQEQEALVLRYASDSAQDHDRKTQDALWTQYGGQMEKTSSAKLFRVLTGHEVGG